MTQQPEQSVPGITYAAAGVDTAAGDRAVALMKDAVAATMTPAVVGGVGGFAGLVDVSALRDYRRPLLATSTDGVGTKVAIAQALDIHDTIGQDLVGMVVDDIVVVGARPLLMTDYIACGHVVPERIADIVRGVAQACAAVGTPLLGGETAEHPGLMAPDEYDVAGAATGVVEADRMLGAEKVHAGDVLVALGSSGLHSNGYSLVRRVIEHAGWDLEREVPEFGRALGQELLEPTRLYTRVCLAMLETLSSPAAPGPVHALSHITGGGLAANVARAATGVVEADRMLGAEKVRAGDVLVALGSSGLHSNGYSLVRRVIEHAGWGLEREVPEFGRTLGQELLEPTRLYTRVCLAMLETLSSPAAPGPIHALSHITGGGLAANVARVLPAGLIADVDRASWTVPPVFSTVRELGSVPWEDLEGTLNLGVGMVAVVDPSAVDAILRVAEGSDIPAWVLGEVHEARTYEAQDRVVSGTKGVDGGAVDIHGAYRTS